MEFIHQNLAMIMFASVFILLLLGYPVAFSLGGVSLIFGLIGFGPQFFQLLPLRIWGRMTNFTLLAVPLFVYMGVMLERSGLAEELLETMGLAFARLRGGLAISVVIVGALLGASTGIVGATVVTMGLLSLPTMLKQNYKKSLATGTVAASGTLGQIIPPSIVLIVLADVFQLPVGDLFKAAVMPGLTLVGVYIVYILIVSFLDKNAAPAMRVDESLSRATNIKKALLSIIPPLTLIVLVLGSIFAGIATPTESASLGALGSMLLALMYRKLSYGMVREASLETVKTTAMVFAILIGATAFSMVFIYSGADEIVENFMTTLPGEKWGFLILTMLIIMFLGFFIDFIEHFVNLISDYCFS